MSVLPIEKKISSKIIQIQEDEIKRIAVELHEGVGQTLYSLYTGLQVIESGIDHPEMKDYVGEMAGLLEKTIREIRFLTVELHPPSLSTFGLVAALKNYSQLFTTTYGIVVDIESNGEKTNLSERERITLFRVCQEALGNIAKYADTAKAAIRLNWTSTKLFITIQDKGKGFIIEDDMNKSSGLAAMRERIHLIGGEWAISSTIEEGTMIEMSLPL
ncbi:sensor histidine kinase [Lederbergia citrea]|uniref:sensor histidine kinase n=1 Tax=Lederbergia citrea TaxID=2833581 RepID=UPI001BCA2279|nr:ATP-binding protein [Lederbergia citrea]MBS4179251.1 sensor histidine kinase [Lederbergia citrea]